MNIDILGIDGSNKGSLELDGNVFGIEPNVALMHQAVKMHLANRRQGTHKVKGRSEVRGGGKKPWRQKGRGTARAGTTRSPLWVGGGTIFGPHPHSYRQDMPKKMRRLARRSALSLKVQASELLVVENLTFSEIKTKPFAAMLKAIDAAGKKSLVLLSAENENVLRSGRNIANCRILTARDASTYDILNNQVLILEQGAVQVFQEMLSEGSAASTATSTATPTNTEEEAGA